MGIETEIRLEPEYLCLVCKGNYSHGESMKAFKTAIEAAIESDRSRVVVDARGVHGDVSTLRRYDIGVYISELVQANGPSKITRIATVTNAPLTATERFAETVAYNRGVNMKATTDLAEAIAWISG